MTPITVKYESPYRRIEYNEETMEMTVIDTYYVHQSLVPQIIEYLTKGEKANA